MATVHIIAQSVLVSLLGVFTAQAEQAPQMQKRPVGAIAAGKPGSPAVQTKRPLPVPGQVTPPTTPPTQDSVTAVRLCDDKIGFAMTPPPSTAKPTEAPEGGKSCYTAKPKVAYPTDEVLRAIYAKKISIQTRTQALIKELNDYPDTVLDVIANSYNVDGKVIEPIDFVKLLNRASLTAKKISFYFDLCYQIYYKGSLTTNPNTSSDAYKKLLLAKQDQVKGISGDINRIDQFSKTLEQELSQKNMARLGGRTLETRGQKRQVEQGSSSMESKQKQDLGYESKQTAAEHGMEHRFGTEGRGMGVHSGSGEEEASSKSAEAQNVTIKTLTPEIVKSLAHDYIALFGKEDLSTINFESLSVAQLENILSKRRLDLEQRQIDAETDLRIFSDPNLRDFWAKLDQVLKTDAEGFIPIDVFYRTTASYTVPLKILDKIAKFKKNDKNPQDKKEISGVMLFKEGKATSPTAAPVDEIAIVFSGSNSYEDWKHNLDFFKQEGLAAHNIASNLRAHRGIMNSLKESLDEAGSKVKNWVEKYKAKRGTVSQRPTLRITVAGHSLGGALALLTGVFIKQNVADLLKPIADLDVVVVTFGAPPIFNQLSAKKVDETILKKQNILRFWNIGDPVANMSVLVKDSRKVRSPIATLLGYYHVGTSIPLFDTDKMGNMMEVFNPWKNHLSNRYANLLYGNWQELGNEKLQALQKIMAQRSVIQDQKLVEQIDQLINFIEESPESSNKIDGLELPTLVKIIQTANEAPKGPLESTISNVSALQQQRYEEGKADPLKFAKVDLSNESKSIQYNHKIKGNSIAITLDRSTSCKINNLGKKSNFNPSKFAGTDQAEISCACCIVKNTFVSYGGGNILQRMKDTVTKKDTKTPGSILQFCEDEKHCANPDVKKKLFPLSEDLMLSYGRLMKNLGLEKEWLSKKVK